MPEDPSNPILSSQRSIDRTPDQGQAAQVEPASDEILLERVRARDREAMTQIFDRYSGMVYSIALRVLGDKGHAEDIMQDVLIKVWCEPERFVQGRGSMGAWLAVVARHRAIDMLRRRKPTDAVEDVVLASRTNLASEIERNTIMEKVRGVLTGLPREQQMLVELAFFEGLSHSEIAARTGDPLGTVKTRIRSALMIVRKAFQP
jgi:RNA polymerase sigma-70 factor (ECF subfamily)